ncbi:MAG: translation initiation factor IF-2 [Eubacterium sp.]|nr:translation initiation factor IF-2 [Eubacterium sp.]
MPKKVYELAKELGVASKELLEKAAKLGIDAANHMSVLSDTDVKRLSAKGGTQRPAGKAVPGQVSGRVGPVGRPIVNDSYFEHKKKAPAGKPVVDDDFLAKREKAREEAKEAGEVKKTAPTAEHAPEVKKPEAVHAPEKPVETVKPVEAKPVKPQKEAEITPEKAPADQKITESEAVKASADNNAGSAEAKKVVKAASDHQEVKPKKKEKKEETVPKKNLDAEIKVPKVKIVRTAAEDDEQAQKAGRKPERKQGQKPVGRKPKGRPGQRPQQAEAEEAPKPSSRRLQRPQQAQQSSDSSRDNKHGRKGNDKRHGKYEGGFDKFDKMERKSLERQERKKYTKEKHVEEEEEVILPEGTFRVNVPITVAGFCEQVEVSISQVIMTLMKLGIMATQNQNIDEATLEVLAQELGINVVVGSVAEETEEEIAEEAAIEDFDDKEEDLVERPPVITVMGHVDHGKTSLLDAIRKTNVTAQESGGITQHIGASEVRINGRKIVFLDTPGHEAFTAMRARGALITDIAVLVVAADDSVKPQTIESISHAKAAGVPIIVAINKMDKPGANPDKVKKDLADQGVLVEDWGGEVISVPVSAKTGDGIKDLLEMILLQADVLELKANPNRMAKGTVIEARLDKARGPVATLLVANGTLRSGDSIVAGTCSGHIRVMTDFKGKKIKKAGPATAVEILGLTDVPQAGDEFNAVKDDKSARDIAEARAQKLREEVLAKNASTTLDKLFTEMQEGEVKELNVIIKGDVQGSVGALISSLEKLNGDSVKVNVIHSGVGTVTESDVMLAQTSGSIIIGFNVRPSTAVTTAAERDGVEIRLYRVIYDVINDVEAAMKGMLEPDYKEEILGKAVIRDTFKVPNVGVVGGAYVTEGKVVRNAEIRLVRDGIVILEGKISSLKRFKDDAKEVAQGYECGIGIEDYNDIKEGDEIECFRMVEVAREEL